MPLKGLKEKLNYITCSILLIQPSQRILQIWWKYSQLSNFVRCCNRQIFNVINTAKSILYLHYHLGQFGASYFQMPIHFFLAFLFICSVTSNLIFEFSSILSIATVISLLLLWFFYLFVFVPRPPSPHVDYVSHPLPVTFLTGQRGKVRRISCHSESKPQVTSDGHLTCSFNLLRFTEKIAHTGHSNCVYVHKMSFYTPCYRNLKSWPVILWFLTYLVWIPSKWTTEGFF